MTIDHQSREETMLVEAQSREKLASLKVFAKLSGPGWMQSAITLGGGSLAGSLFLGVTGGYELLWVQWLAMLMGITMLCAIAHVTLSTERSPFDQIRKHINPVLAWGWLAATLMANMVWVLPQYSLAYGAVTENLLPGVIEDSTAMRFAVSIVFFFIVTAITLSYGKGHAGVRIYEWVLKGMVGCIVLAFVAVVFQLFTTSNVDMTAVLSGFIPRWKHLFEPVSAYQSILSQIDDVPIREYWNDLIVQQQRQNMIGAAAAAVGINMTFLLPFSMMNKGWNRHYRGLAKFDLCTSLLIPFLIATSCVVIASASMFHGQPHRAIYQVNESGDYRLLERKAGDAVMFSRLDHALEKRENTLSLQGKPIMSEDSILAAMLLKRDNLEFGRALSSLMGARAGQIIFGMGVLAMGLSTISLLMLISGYVICEAFGFEHGGREHKLGTLLGASGLLWPLLWSGQSKAYLAVITSTFGYILLPIAFLTFFLMMNSRKVLGAEMPKGAGRVIWNTLMGISLLVTGAAAAYSATTKTLHGYPVGTISLLVFVVMVISGHVVVRNRHRSLATHDHDNRSAVVASRT